MNQLGVRPEAGHCQPQTEDNDSNINQLHLGWSLMENYCACAQETLWMETYVSLTRASGDKIIRSQECDWFSNNLNRSSNDQDITFLFRWMTFVYSYVCVEHYTVYDNIYIYKNMSVL